MAINKVEYGGKTLIDLTQDTVTPETLVKGTTAHDKSGEQIVGTFEGGGGGGGNSVVDFLAGTAKEVIDTSGVVTSLNQYAFYENDGIEIVRLPAVMSIGAYNFRSCSNLTTIDLPEMTGSTGTYFATSASHS